MSRLAHLTYTRFPQPGTVPPGDEHYSCRVYFHRLGDDQAKDEELFLGFTSFTYPPAVYRYDFRTGRRTAFAKTTSTIDPSAYEWAGSGFPSTARRTTRRSFPSSISNRQ